MAGRENSSSGFSHILGSASVEACVYLRVSAGRNGCVHVSVFMFMCVCEYLCVWVGVHMCPICLCFLCVSMYLYVCVHECSAQLPLQISFSRVRDFRPGLVKFIEYFLPLCSVCNT